MTAKLSTHVLDTYHGCPAAGIAWSLERLGEDGDWRALGEGATNAGGRTDAPLLEGEALVAGRYRLSFGLGDYFRAKGLELPEPAFLEDVVIEVGLRAGESYHVPLLASPWSYSTYRGS